MKPTILINVITAFGLMSLTSAASLLVSQAEAEAMICDPGVINTKAICGDLGDVMDTTNLPDWVNPNEVRTCKEHPEGDAGPAGKSPEIQKCWFGSNLGCSENGYCFKSCGRPGSGQWCWTAENGGHGKWITCSSARDCHLWDACGAGGCDKCGCSC
ncbi:hypothetical protein V8E54_004713 [Elaphomyces granulatus]